MNNPNSKQEKSSNGKWSLRLFHYIVGSDKVWTSVFYDTFGSTEEAEEAGEQLVADPESTVATYEAF